MLNKQRLIIVIGVLLVTVGLFVGVTLNGSTNEAPQAPQINAPETESINESSTVIYDDEGFTPKIITVAKGTTVNFDNKTNIPMWVASDPHPDHTEYPELDAINVTGDYPEPKNDFRFTFDMVGTWTYHSHTFPDHTATVIVN